MDKFDEIFNDELLTGLERIYLALVIIAFVAVLAASLF